MCAERLSSAARRRERLFDIHGEMTPLQPGHEKGG
jgi:hypothetical protein